MAAVYEAQKATQTAALSSSMCSSYEEMNMGREKASCRTDELRRVVWMWAEEVVGWVMSW